MARYNKIRKMDISNGPGVRVSVFMQGCTFNCKNCFNPETHDFNGGKEFTDDTINEILNLCNNGYIAGLSILGGEPLHNKNIDASTKLAKAFKEKYPDKSVWIWTGFNFEDYVMDKEITKYADFIVDGQFEEDNKNPKLLYSGSSNQRVINVKKTMKKGKVVEENNL